MPSHFFVQRNALATTNISDAEPLSPKTGEAVIHVDRFALTANNITYGVAGDAIGYWNFFPAPDDWGRIPVWGIGTVSASEHPDIATGTRYYGYFPMSTELLVQPDKVTAGGFIDAAAHRSQLPAVYNQYRTYSADNGFSPEYENHHMLYRPLFTTSFVLDDYFADNNFFGATTMILGSASSKTAFGLAFMLRRRTDIKVVGLTSTKNLPFVNRLGLYHDVLTYDDVESLALEPSAYVDMAGNREVLVRVHRHLGDSLVNSCGVGITHWEARDADVPADLPGAKPTMFFAPTQIVKRNEELGSAVYQQRIGEATGAFLAEVDNWVTIEEHPFDDLEAVYQTVLQGAPPERGFVVTG